MLEVVEAHSEKKMLQQRLPELLSESWTYARRYVTSGTRARLVTVQHNRRVWFASMDVLNQSGTPRFCNLTGAYAGRGELRPALQINIPKFTNSKAVSGFFARDPISGARYLMHDGALGLGEAGIDRNSFIRWSSLQQVETKDSAGNVRLALTVAPIVSDELAAGIESFMARVSAFRAAPRAGKVASGVAIEIPRTSTESKYADYYREFSGRKWGTRSEKFEYVTRHGDVVDALASWRQARAAQGEQLVKDPRIDLAVTRHGVLRELYEVKTNTDRDTLYGAIGQLVVHASSDNVERYLVVPAAGEIATDISRALARLNISTVYFVINGEHVQILE